MLENGSMARPAQGTQRMKMLRWDDISARLWDIPPRKGSDGITGQPTTEDMYANDHRTQAGPASKT